MVDNLRVAINAQLTPGGACGGVEQFVMGLVHALGCLQDGPEEYVVVCPYTHPDWLRTCMGANQRIVRGPAPPQAWKDRLEPVKQLLGPMRRPAGEALRTLRRRRGQTVAFRPAVVPKSDGFFEGLGVNLVHFPFQQFARCELPTIFNPHDLQHLHYPEFFTPEQMAVREAVYPTACRLADAVAAESVHARLDIIEKLGLAPDKVYAIHRGPPTEIINDCELQETVDVREKFRLWESFVLYPAQTWQHKNHLRLLKAIRLVRDTYGIRLNLVCTGRQNDLWPVIETCVQELALDHQVRFLGFVSVQQLRSLYRAAQFMVFPSLFEGGGFPILEAFKEGTPVACSTATSLPEYGGDAALYFDPASEESMASAIYRLHLDTDLRADLKARGIERIARFTWDHTARVYRALYRSVARHTLAVDDAALLAEARYISRVEHR